MNKAKNFIQDKWNFVKKNAKKLVRTLDRKYGAHKKRTNFQPGKLLAFTYKAKDATKRYDKKPLVICLGPPKNPKLRRTHTYGLNIHWLPIRDRVKVASFFVELMAKRKGKLHWDDVKPFINKFKGHQVLRMYIIERIGDKVIEMPPEVYLTAASVPSEVWMGGK